MELGEHEPNEPPVADCDCRRCAVATRDALRKDAERYRWLRDAENGGELSVGQQCSVCDEYPKYEEVAWYYDIELDGLIDAAMQRAKAVGAA